MTRRTRCTQTTRNGTLGIQRMRNPGASPTAHPPLHHRCPCQPCPSRPRRGASPSPHPTACGSSPGEACRTALVRTLHTPWRSPSVAPGRSARQGSLPGSAPQPGGGTGWVPHRCVSAGTGGRTGPGSAQGGSAPPPLQGRRKSSVSSSAGSPSVHETPPGTRRPCPLSSTSRR